MKIGLGFVYKVLKDIGVWVSKRLEKPTPEEILKKRFEKKREFEENLPHLINSDIIIRDINRMDSYPDIDEKGRGISPWFKLGFKALYHKGVELFMSVESVRFDHAIDVWAACKYDDDEAVNALVVGRIAYETIIQVDWAGDEYYPFPHLYCQFNKSKMPYDEIICVVPEKLGDKEVFREIGAWPEIVERSKETRWKRITRRFSRRGKPRG